MSIADRLHDLVKESDCDPKQITLEVTESEVMIDVAKVLNVLARLRMKGFGLSIDDFGTGYSSLQQLSNVPFTELKVDQSFVKDAPTQPRHRTIIETSLDLARKLKLKTVAEGVETRAEWDLLKSLGCEQAQGYFIARPMPGHQIPVGSGCGSPGCLIQDSARSPSMAGSFIMNANPHHCPTAALSGQRFVSAPPSSPSFSRQSPEPPPAGPHAWKGRGPWLSVPGWNPISEDGVAWSRAIPFRSSAA